MRLTSAQKKILLLLLGGVALGFSGNSKVYFKILKALAQEWKEIDRQSLKRNIINLQKSKLLYVKTNADGDYFLMLTEFGKKFAEQCNLENITINKAKKWDQTWRVVISDIPEHRKKARERFRFLLKNLGFYPLQKSVYVCPYQCLGEIGVIVEALFLQKYVKVIIAHYIDGDKKVRNFFNID